MLFLNLKSYDLISKCFQVLLKNSFTKIRSSLIVFIINLQFLKKLESIYTINIANKCQNDILPTIQMNPVSHINVLCGSGSKSFFFNSKQIE